MNDTVSKLDICAAIAHGSPMTQDADQTLDARGLMCPLPVLKVAKTLRAMPPNAVVRILADDPIAVIDIPHFCVETGHTLISQSNDGDHQAYLIRRRT